MGKLEVVVGGQYGSEGKGALTAHLAKKLRSNDLAVRVAGPNAGHSVVSRNQTWRLRQLPVAAAVSSAQLAIAAGSEVELAVLEDEIMKMEQKGYQIRSRLVVDAQVTLIEEKYKEREKDVSVRIGATGKGVGASKVARIMREAKLYGGEVDVSEKILEILKEPENTVQIEGAQGYALGFHAGYYPFCTSNDCRAIDMLAMAGISPWESSVEQLDVWVVTRTYPIRVAGNSGPLPKETNWDDLNKLTNGYIRPERTTVTQNIRRVAFWDSEIVKRAMRANGSNRAKVALMMFDYWFPETFEFTQKGLLSTKHLEKIASLEIEIGSKIGFIGTGPDSGIELN